MKLKVKHRAAHLVCIQNKYEIFSMSFETKFIASNKKRVLYFKAVFPFFVILSLDLLRFPFTNGLFERVIKKRKIDYRKESFFRMKIFAMFRTEHMKPRYR